MRKNALAALLLTFICTLTAGHGQVRRTPVTTTNDPIRLSPYGVLLSMPGPKGEGVTQLKYEGYRLTVRVKDAKTGKENKVVVYAFGEQQVSANLKPVRVTAREVVVETTDQSLKITTTVQEKNGILEIIRRIMSKYDNGVFERIDLQLESLTLACRMLGGLVFGGGDCTECQGCGCVEPNCIGGKNWAMGTVSFRTFDHALPDDPSDPPSPTPQDVAIMTWSEGVNFKSITLNRGQSIVLRETIPINPEDAGKLRH